ncbi:glutamine amidotransferase [Agromyces intestinalis]|uniref:Glutamine amidotransferase n=1 Tax=Agromyces intestinalis TaxID=2592652 RepID=A0A5C1YFX5_9MICO|nr:glutamine amidotransferase [Agromyces intestinalis]QEO15096.1 glutamine amidotransferase [Agromyces intestinalis]
MPADHRPVLLVTVRPEAAAADAEAESVRFAADLPAERVVQLRLDLDPLDSIDLDGFASVVVGGSPFNVTTPESSKSPVQRRVEADLVRLAEHGLVRDLPVLFTCYGIGVLTRVLGGVVGPEYGEAVGPVAVALTEAGRTDPLTAGLAAPFTALVGHKEATTDLPSGATLLAGSSTCPVQVYRATGSRVYATQFHPEVTTDSFRARATLYRDYGYFPSSELDAIAEVVRGTTVTEPLRLLQRFVELAAE